MRIVIDLQGAQTNSSRGRGIGRYTQSLALAMARCAGKNEIIIALNENYPKSIAPIIDAFESILPSGNVRVWRSMNGVTHANPDHEWRRKAAELVYESFLLSLKPDVILISSFFEGLVEDALTSIGGLNSHVPVAVILYDLIPLINRRSYLTTPATENWYNDKIEKLTKADLLLAISDSSRSEAVQYLGFDGDDVINIGTAADPQFTKINITSECASTTLARNAIVRPFVMYTGGIDHRKNIEGLIRAFSLLPKSVRIKFQLAIVCSINDEWRKTLGDLAKKSGLELDEVVFTGFISEDDLVAMYHLCAVFVFPSWHEGFGLPALEAMSCGAPVIAANTSSLPEVIGWDDALFDPYDDQAIADKIKKVLTEPDFREQLVAHGQRQCKKFAWDDIGIHTLQSLENLALNHSPSALLDDLPRRSRLAFVSPLPPERSGISDYSAELLPALALYYDIDVIVSQNRVSDVWVAENCAIRDVEWFRDHSAEYERVLYHFGNSHFHLHMFDLLEEIPGVVVLHDFFLSGAVFTGENSGMRPHGWSKAIQYSHGYAALADRFSDDDVHHGMSLYPSNRDVLENARSVIVHSKYSLELAAKWYGQEFSRNWTTIPLLRIPAQERKRQTARRALGIGDDVFLVCSFGFLAPTKLNHRLLDAWLESNLANNRRCKLVFVGQNHGGDYGRDLLAKIENSGMRNRIYITGWTDTEDYFQYLAAADVGVQLRTNSRGETSAAVLDCMNYGLATIVNGNGSMAALPKNAVMLMSDEFENAELIAALEALVADEDLTKNLGIRGAEHIREFHAPDACALQYRDAIEAAYARDDHLIAQAVKISPACNNSGEWLALAEAVASNNRKPIARQLLVDVSAIVGGDPRNGGYYPGVAGLAELLLSPPDNFVVEPVYFSMQDEEYFYAKRFSLRLLGIREDALEDSKVEFSAGDIYFGLAPMPRGISAAKRFFECIKSQGVKVYFSLTEALDILRAGRQEEISAGSYDWLAEVGVADGVLVSSSAYASLVSYLDVFCVYREGLLPMHVVSLKEATDAVGLFGSRTTVQDLVDIILGNQWGTSWRADGTVRVWGADMRLGTQVGMRVGRSMVSANKQGYLVYGPYIPLVSGDYIIRLKGGLDKTRVGGARIDAAINRGEIVLGESHAWFSENDECIISFPVSIKTNCRDLEVRVWVSAETELEISMLEIVPVAVKKAQTVRVTSVIA